MIHEQGRGEAGGGSVTTSSSTCRLIDLKTSVILSTELILLVNSQ